MYRSVTSTYGFLNNLLFIVQLMQIQIILDVKCVNISFICFIYDKLLLISKNQAKIQRSIDNFKYRQVC